MIKNIIFDLGNVLMTFQPVEFLKTKGLCKQDIDFVYREIFLSDEWIKLDKGIISKSDALKAIYDRNPEQKQILKENSNFKELLKPIKKNVIILEELKRKQFKIYYLTNYHEDLFDYSLEKFPFFKNFDGGIVSAHVKLIKPDPEIYKNILNKYDLDPLETLFIDDSEKNTLAAEKFNMKTIHLKDQNKLSHSLLKFNL